MKILFCAGEAVPFAKTGGLADVAGSLPQALGRLGADVLVVMPKYRGLTRDEARLSDRVRVRFVEHERFFNRAGLYGNDRGDYPDNLERFVFFSREVFEVARRAGFRPDVLHVHDWHAALSAVVLRAQLRGDKFFARTRSVLTIHNLAYQGVFPESDFDKLGLDRSLFSIDGLEFYGKVNLLKGGILSSDAVTTVSPGYAREIETAEYGCGLDGVIRHRHGDLHGILNGIDLEVWNPARDKKIKRPFTAARPKGKEACKADLQRRMGLDPDPAVPVFGLVSRLAHQKGVDLVIEAAPRLLSRRLQLAVLGSGDASLEKALAQIARRHPGRMQVRLGYDAQTSNRIYAGSDFFLMPSLFEPCGLGQMIAMRYGSLPVARRTGGLADTVVDASESAGNGVLFDEASPSALLEAVDRALELYGRPERYLKARQRAMRADFSWERSAAAYLALYRRLIRKART